MNSPAFTSWHDFFAMGGYGTFVWLAALSTWICFGALVVHELTARRRLLREIARQAARARRIAIANRRKQERDR